VVVKKVAKKKVYTKRPGPVPKKIDWEKVKRLCHVGALGTEIAATQGVCPQTLSDRCQKDLKITFTELRSGHLYRGNCHIREKQFEKALSGDNTMLIWVGKNRLEQSDNQTINSHELRLNVGTKEFKITKAEKVAIYKQIDKLLQVNDDRA